MDRERSLRFRAGQLRLSAAMLDFTAAAIEAERQMRAFVAAHDRSVRQKFESHPDVQEVVAQVRGFYED